jgi:hypothetical protein
MSCDSPGPNGYPLVDTSVFLVAAGQEVDVRVRAHHFAPAIAVYCQGVIESDAQAAPPLIGARVNFTAPLDSLCTVEVFSQPATVCDNPEAGIYNIAVFVDGVQPPFFLGWFPGVQRSVLADRCSEPLVLGALGEASPVTMDITLHTHNEDPLSTDCRKYCERTAWFVWQAPGPGTATVDTRDGNYDTALNVYITQFAECPSSPEPFPTGHLITCNDDADSSSGDYTSEVSFPVLGGEVYFIEVEGCEWDGESPTFRLNVNYTP